MARHPEEKGDAEWIAGWDIAAMSFDIVVLKLEDLGEKDLSNVEAVQDIGCSQAVIASMELMFPGCVRGAFSDGERYSLESVLNGDPVSSIHLTLRFGRAWSEAANAEFTALLSTLCQRLQSVAFAVSDNSRLAPPYPVTLE
ncbi:hypothetical protein [Stenotrophomonas maltophilia]|nr:hypothetical protein [Stenotrophomonas maltophilia]UKJ27586.1 hypothetical protein L6173_09825 [Stenotrophomonas maltophilia]GFF06139.1 hypothetical protein SM139_1283 [Stenotrophomonas maltophilia]